MHTLKIDTTLDWTLNSTDRTARLMRLFGLRLNRLKEQRLHHECTVRLKPGQICFITGSSGAGKSVLLNALYEQVPSEQRMRLEEIGLEQDAAMIDCVNLEPSGLFATVEMFSKAGLSDVFSLLNSPSKLSAGQQWRYRLAKALLSRKPWIFADEFTDSVDRITAAVIAHNLRKLAVETGRIFVLASCHEDMLTDLQPDVIVLKYLNGKTHTIYKDQSQAGNW